MSQQVQAVPADVVEPTLMQIGARQIYVSETHQHTDVYYYEPTGDDLSHLRKTSRGISLTATEMQQVIANKERVEQFFASGAGIPKTKIGGRGIYLTTGSWMDEKMVHIRVHYHGHPSRHGIALREDEWMDFMLKTDQ